jgi:glycosyltransferase involved in cell wall biosynthesis
MLGLMNILILSDHHRGSYHIIGNFYESCLTNFGEVTHLPTPKNQDERNALAYPSKGTIVLHNTLGEGFVPVPGCYNIAMPLHEWSEYPRAWIHYLNQFDEIWTTTEHIRELLSRGGLVSPSFHLPPALDNEKFAVKDCWEIRGKPKFFFVGEPHFRKGNHLLIHGYLKAFTNPDEAQLTIKTSPDCKWASPREDIIVIKENWSREKLLLEYAQQDCFVSASLGEGLGLPIAEAIISRLPVCTNFWGGHKCLLEENSFVRIEHEEILQPYSSDPIFYADGQKCAFSAPGEIKKSLMSFLALKADQRQAMSVSAKKHFSKRYGSTQASRRIQERIAEIEKKYDPKGIERTARSDCG